MKKKCLWLGISMFVCLLVCEIVVNCMPKIYKSSFVISLNTEEQLDKTIDLKNDYSLGLSHTRNYMRSASVCEIIASDAFLHNLLQTEVKTLDDSFSGTLNDYLLYRQRGLFGTKKVNEQDNASLVSDDEVWYSKNEVALFRSLRRLIKGEVEYETQFVTITCTAQDPRVATMMARHTEQLLQEEILRFEQQKRKSVLAQLASQVEIADARLAQAREMKSSNLAECQQIAESFHRQQVMYEAQVVPTRMFLTLSEPSIDYRKAGPSRIKVPVVLTCLLGLILVGWWERRRIVAFFQD